MAAHAPGSQLAPSKRPSPRCAPPAATGTASRTPPQFDPQQHAAGSTSRRQRPHSRAPHCLPPTSWSPALRAISYPKVTKPFCRLPSPCIRFIDQSLFSLKTCCGSWYGARRYSRAASPRTTWVSRAEAHRVRTRRRGLGPLLWLGNGPRRTAVLARCARPPASSPHKALPRPSPLELFAIQGAGGWPEKTTLSGRCAGVARVSCFVAEFVRTRVAGCRPPSLSGFRGCRLEKKKKSGF